MLKKKKKKRKNSVENNNVPIIRTLSSNKERYLLTQSNYLLAKIKNPSVKATKYLSTYHTDTP